MQSIFLLISTSSPHFLCLLSECILTLHFFSCYFVQNPQYYLAFCIFYSHLVSLLHLSTLNFIMHAKIFMLLSHSPIPRPHVSTRSSTHTL